MLSEIILLSRNKYVWKVFAWRLLCQKKFVTLCHLYGLDSFEISKQGEIDAVLLKFNKNSAMLIKIWHHAYPWFRWERGSFAPNSFDLESQNRECFSQENISKTDLMLMELRPLECNEFRLTWKPFDAPKFMGSYCFPIKHTRKMDGNRVQQSEPFSQDQYLYWTDFLRAQFYFFKKWFVQRLCSGTTLYKCRFKVVLTFANCN